MHPAALHGDPLGQPAATPAKGRAVVDAAAQQLALLLQEIARLPLSTLRERSD